MVKAWKVVFQSPSSFPLSMTSMTSGQPTLTFLCVLSDLEPLRPCRHLVTQQTHWLGTNNKDDERDGRDDDDNNDDDDSDSCMLMF